MGVQGKTSKRRQYTAEFKHEAVRLVTEGGLSVANKAILPTPIASVMEDVVRRHMHCTLIASGPDFKVGFVDETPSGIVDLAPTVLHLLGLPASPTMAGRLLKEALRGATAIPAVQSGKLEASSKLNGQTRSQYLLWQKVDGTVYFDEGNSGMTP